MTSVIGLVLSLNSKPVTNMEYHKPELKLNSGVKLKIILLIMTKQFMFITSFSFNFGAIQQDAILKFNFPTNISPSCTQKYLHFVQALSHYNIFILPSFPLFHWKNHFSPLGFSLKSDLWLSQRSEK